MVDAHGGFITHDAVVNWVLSDTFHVGFGARMDQLALTMTLVVTGVGLAIFVYALGYMHGDESMGRFYAKFALFVFSMLGIVVSPNFFQTFVFWELVGASSYLLIGYYWKKHSAGEAAKKAFMTNRVGDFGFLLGILMVWAGVGVFAGKIGVPGFEALGAVDFTVIQNALSLQTSNVMVFDTVFFAGLAAALVFAGAMGKSAQFPLHVWLPDAMEGPTPVSALMHAATMVAAGIYMVARCFFLFENTTWAPTLLACIGTITAFIAATIAMTQRDIKKVLAYSTLSQLGYMTMALGAGAYTAAHVPPDDARLLQGAALPLRRIRDPRLPPRPGHLRDGRPAHEDEVHGDHLPDRHAGALRHLPVRRLLVEGRDPRRHGPRARTRSHHSLLGGRAHRRPHVVLHDARLGHRLPRASTGARTTRTRARR